MSYPRIQQFLAADSMFADRVSVKDTEVVTGSGKELFSSLVVNTFNALAAAGYNMQSVPRMVILGTAARLVTGQMTPVAAPVQPPAPAAPAPARKKAAAVQKVAPKVTPKAEPKVAAKAPQQSTTKHVVVTTARSGAPRPVTIEKPVDAEVIQRYQCSVASAQLLAALHQLFERDEWPGHEQRKKKLDDLINEVEQSSSEHVNLSVKAIIRDQTTPARK